MLLLKDNGVSFLWYGGAAWWGKTILAALWISMMCSKYPWVRYWVFRRYITDALDSTFQSFTKALWILWLNEAPNVDILKRDKENKYDYVVRNGGKEITFRNGSEVWFRWLQDKPTDIHFTKIWWLELTGGYVDEANECPEMGIWVLKKRVWRHLNIEYKIPRKVLCTFNPDKWWVYRTFYMPFKQWNEIEWTKFIKALPTDNEYLSKEYIEELENEKNEVLRQRLRFWNFDYDATPWRLFEYDNIVNLWNNGRDLWDYYVTCDAARKGKDKAVIYLWNGWFLEEKTEYAKCSNTDIENEIKRLQVLHWFPMTRVIVDEDWVWWGIVDHLWCKWFINNSSAISPANANKVSYKKKNYVNLKTQCYFLLADKVNEWGISILPTDLKNDLIQELDVVVEVNLDKDAKKRICDKEYIKEKLWRSPDYADALMMRMYFELKKQWPEWETITNEWFDFEIDWVSWLLPEDLDDLIENEEVSLSPY